MVSLAIQGLHFHYKSKRVFEAINMSVHNGEILSLVGPNGAGKTTLLKCINRLHEADKGDILIHGESVRTMKRHELAQKVAYVPQAAPIRFPVTVFDVILLGRRPYIQWRPSKADLNKVEEVIAKMGLQPLALQDMSQLSGGERQKVMIAKALVQEPHLLLFDEPSTYLDLNYQLKMMALIREWVDTRNIAAVITTHDLNLALRYSDQIAVLHDGKIAANGAPEILNEALIRQVYGVDAAVREEAGAPYIVPISAV